jgi:hypothetical protein
MKEICVYLHDLVPEVQQRILALFEASPFHEDVYFNVFPVCILTIEEVLDEQKKAEIDTRALDFRTHDGYRDEKEGMCDAA